MPARCLLCGNEDTAEVFTLTAIPVLCNQLWPDKRSARAAPTGDIHLVVCPRCGLLFNRSFDAARMIYGQGYENALHYSPTFQEYARDLAAHLVSRYGLAGKTVVEIGCGDGYMLQLLVEAGVGWGVGYDPSVRNDAARDAFPSNVTLIPEYFHGQLATSPDAIACRHVLEHTPNPLEFLRGLRRALGPAECLVYFEVPNGRWLIDSKDPWDIIYEHVTYWTEPAISALFRRAGFEPLAVSIAYGGQFLQVEAVPSARASDDPFREGDLAQVVSSALAFGDAAAEGIEGWRVRLGELAAAGGSALIWGAGSKGITFANLVGSSPALIGLADVNPRKWRLVAPGTGLPVIAPGDLGIARPDVILVSNAIYASEVQAIVNRHGLRPGFASIVGGAMPQ